MAALRVKRSRSQSLEPLAAVKRSRSETPSTASKKNARFLVMSDTHGAELPVTLPECDVLLHCGDLTEDGSADSIAKAIEALGNIRAELKLVIAGNHDISLDAEYYLSESGAATDAEKAKDIISKKSTSEATQNGITFLSEGTYIFTLSSGATFSIYASPYTPKHGASAFQYPSNKDRFNPPGVAPPWAQSTGTEASIIPLNVDIIMTHGPPQYILDRTADGQSAGCEHLRRALERVRPALHCFGHIHSGYGAQRVEYKEVRKVDDSSDPIILLPKEWVGRNQARKKGYSSIPPGSLEEFREGGQTLCVNAAMEDDEGKLENAPWLVELELPVRIETDVRSEEAVSIEGEAYSREA